jgi:hypothetical protein
VTAQSLDRQEQWFADLDFWRWLGHQFSDGSSRGRSRRRIEERAHSNDAAAGAPSRFTVSTAPVDDRDTRNSIEQHQRSYLLHGRAAIREDEVRSQVR